MDLKTTIDENMSSEKPYLNEVLIYMSNLRANFPLSSHLSLSLTFLFS